MTWFLIFLGASVFSSIFVLAAGMLSSRMNRRDDYVETFYMDTHQEQPARGTAQAPE